MTAPMDSQARPRVLLVEDTVSLARIYIEYLKNEPLNVVHVETGKAAREAIADRVPDVVLLDLVLPDMDGLDILKEIYEKQIPSGVIIITAHGSLKVAVDAMRYGAVDFIVKPFTADRLTVTLRNTLERLRLGKIVETYQKAIDRREYCGFIGASLPMQAVYRTIDSAAASKATVFITGESGTGKEVCAEAIHRQSPRAKKPFIALNCGAIPKDLMESEIFGHVKGAFTGAQSDRDGAAALADGGTLFLDEICEMDFNLQTKLLRFIQTGVFRKVGGSSDLRVDARFVCATNRDPMAEVTAGRFREDLFYRLHVVPIVLPPLRERGRDIMEIAESFLETFADEEGRRFKGFSGTVENILLGYGWPGNVRQLQNVVRNIVVLNDGEEVSTDMLPPPLDQVDISSLDFTANSSRSASPGIGVDSRGSPGFGGWFPRVEGDIRSLADMEREYIEKAIDVCSGNIPRAAAMLGVSASTIYRKKANWQKRACL